MKTLLVLLLAIAVAACAAALTPDFAIQSEVWTLDADIWMWDVRPCAHIVYFAGPVALEDRSDCGLPWAVTTR